MEKKVYRSRVSVLLLLFITVTCGIVFIPIIRYGGVFNPAGYIVAGTLIFCYAIFFGMSYTIISDRLFVKYFGIITQVNVEISEIISVERSYNPLSSPAASLKRLKICFKKGSKIKWPYCLISPVREQEFLDTLKEINPDIYIRVNDKKGRLRIWDWDI